MKPIAQARRSTPGPARWSLARLLEGVSEADFDAHYFERAPLLIQGRGQHFRNLLRPSQLDRLFASVSDAQDLQVVRNGRFRTSLPEGAQQRVAYLRNSVARGSSVVLYNAQSHWNAFGQLGRALTESLAAPVGATLFITPERGRGFTRHFDIGDVFVAQLEGCKEWQVYPPAAVLPLESQRYEVDKEAPQPPLLVAMLEPGDLLYLPRGYSHAATAGERASLHVSFYFRPYCWHDFLRDLVDQAAERYPELRARRSRSRGAAPRLAKELLAALAPDAARRADDIARERLVMSLQSRVSRAAPRHSAVDEFRVIDWVERAPHQIAAVRRHPGGLRLSFPRGALEAPSSVEPAFRYMARSRGPFQVSALPGGLSDASKILLVRRLAGLGFLRHAARGPRRR